MEKQSYWDSHYKHSISAKPLRKGTLTYDRRKMYVDLAEPKSKDDSVVDLACSVGHVLSVFQNEGYPNVTGIDLDKGSIEKGEEIYPSLKGRLVEGDILKWMKDEIKAGRKYDHFLFINIWEHLGKEQIVEILHDLPLLINPGGNVVIKVPNAGTLYSNRYLYDDHTHVTFLTVRSFSQLLREHGYDDSAFTFLNDPNVVFGKLKYFQIVAFKTIQFLDKLLLGEGVNNKYQYPTLICKITF